MRLLIIESNKFRRSESSRVSSRNSFTARMKFVILVISSIIAVEAWKHKYGNDFVTYSIGERFERGEWKHISRGFELLARRSSTRWLLLPKLILLSILGDFLIRNETVESKFVLYHWPRVHRLEYKIENHDDLLSFAQIDIIDSDVGQTYGNIFMPIDFLLLPNSLPL